MTDDKTYDVVIAGSGPIGAATAYFLTKQAPELKVAIITQDPTDDHAATYTQAGGCLRWEWEDETKQAMTRETADFIRGLAADGVDVSLIEDHYLYLYTGAFDPSINFSGKKVVEWFLTRAEAAGATLVRQAKITAATTEGDQAVVTAGDQTYRARRALLALGVANAELLDGYELEREKRQLFVLDREVPEAYAGYPHTIGRIGEDGYAYLFLKRTPSGLRYVVGQEDIVEDDEAGANDYWQQLLDAGVADIWPFLREAAVTETWWGFDAGNKQLKADWHGHILAANCGSAARSCAWIGRTLAEQLAI